MKVDQLAIHAQETATYCHSCGEVRTEDELGECLVCGYRICGKDGCSARCLCDDANRLGASISGDVLSPARTDASGDAVENILRAIDRVLDGYAIHAV